MPDLKLCTNTDCKYSCLTWQTNTVVYIKSEKGYDNMAIIKTAILQTHVYMEKSRNINRAAELIASPELKDIDLAVLPEMFCCPYENKYAEPEGGDTWEKCSRLAAEHGIYLIAGSMPEQDEDGHIYNTSYVFDRKGHQIGKHRKMHLFDIDVKGGQYFKESETLTPGNQITVFDTEFGKIGLCICYDFRFPELARLMADQGAEVIIVPAAFNMTTGPLHWELMFRQRAVDNQVYTIGAAPARDMNAGYHSWGHSIAADPWGKVLMEMNEKPEVQVVELDLDEVKKVREQLPLLKHRREDIYKLSQIK